MSFPAYWYVRRGWVFFSCFASFAILLSGCSVSGVPISELPDTKENIRSALNRASKQLNIQVATSSDDEHLYVWNVG
jgi:hypothetical protein